MFGEREKRWEAYFILTLDHALCDCYHLNIDYLLMIANLDLLGLFTDKPCHMNKSRLFLFNVK